MRMTCRGTSSDGVSARKVAAQPAPPKTAAVNARAARRRQDDATPTLAVEAGARGTFVAVVTVSLRPQIGGRSSAGRDLAWYEGDDVGQQHRPGGHGHQRQQRDPRLR